MSILIYTESENGTLKKAAFEVASYAAALAANAGSTVTAVTINSDNTEELYKYGVHKILKVSNDALTTFNAALYADVIKQAFDQENAKTLVLGSAANDKYLAPLLAIKLNAGYVPNVVALPESTSPLTLKRTAFTNKAFSLTQVTTENAIIGLAKNSFGLKEATTTGATEDFAPTLPASNTKVTNTDKATGKVTIADAEIVVSGGRGLKGPESWGMIEELAETLGAATACSKPVSDLGWRPHGEHVGQTGKPVASNLYIAVGISGAIQHLAGVNASKVKVVINNDPEAPFFKAADYGVVGDAFEVVPALIEKLKEYKANNA
ncbi:electron transfer flavoprotein subunit alpha/FixB family protein [Neptunitalea lumnitzerae]|uniref:Electron transfer flavoprotein subunit alpha n=1 Tax=Neptunitalea lumnitzerae TaxID=2965509 RepID=A0ABQ5MI03_9FLAO|nr:electron transfer flavoprotein subunit alpha/FixB family protein [Neptunitalea sp. Y10]GLB49022.1 electron transfer flavoprotein subunit alpha [Neptunitalea sp. Y10]